MDNGFVSLHRKLLDWEWYDDINVKVLFIHLLLKANWKEKDWHGINIKRGSFITSINKLAIETHLSPMQVRVALDKLILTNEITKVSNREYTVITVNNYCLYQDSNTQDNEPVTNQQHTDNKPVTTTNKDNKDNKENNNTYVSEVYEKYKQNINANAKLTDKGKKKILTRLKSYSVEELGQAMANFSADSWWVENNAHRGVAWFFDSDDRIEQFLLLKTARSGGRQQTQEEKEAMEYIRKSRGVA